MAFGHWHHHTGPPVVDEDAGPPTESALLKRKKDDLLSQVSDLGIELTGDETKADLVAAILATIE